MSLDVAQAGSDAREPDPRFRARLGTGLSGLFGIERRLGRVGWPVALLLVLACLTVVLTTLAEWGDRRNFAEKLIIAQDQLAVRCERLMDTQLRPLLRLRKDWLKGRFRRAEDFTAEAEALCEQITPLQVIARVGPDGICTAASSPPDEPDLRGQDLRNDKEWGAVLQKAQTTREEAASQVLLDPARGPTVALAVPVGEGRGPSPTYKGALLARVRLKAITASFVDIQTRNDFVVVVLDGNREILNIGGEASTYVAGQPPTPVSVLDREWQLSVRPTPGFVAANLWRTSRWFFWCGMIGSVVLSVAVYQTIQHRWAERQQSRRHLAALESLTEVSAAISARLGAGQEVLDQLADAARELIGMSMSAIGLLKEDGQGIDVLVSRGFDPVAEHRHFTIEQTPAIQQCARERRIVAFDDVLNDGSLINRQWTEPYGIRSLLLIPLSIENRVMGVMMLGDRATRRFGPSELHLARLWGSQAAVTLANNSLYQQMDQALRTQQRLLEQREILFEVNAAIYQATTIEESLRKIVELAPPALGVDTCMVVLVGEEEGQMVVAAATKPFDEAVVGFRYQAADTHAKDVLETGRILVVEDAYADPAVNSWLKERLRSGSTVYVPMHRPDHKPMGFLAMIRHSPGSFSREQVDVARLFSIRAAAAVEKARLHEQARRDADTKATLLRELNHRVKNNLAGIAGLLSVGAADLPPEARQWLSRLAERIGTMARAHELFSGGMEAVRLSQLVAQVLPSLAVVKPANVAISTDFEEVDLSLRVEKAVSLAIVLHELCYNAIVHGLGEQGTLLIRARTVGQEAIAVDVIDDGRGCAPGDRAAAIPSVSPRWVAEQIGIRSSGLGLQLVNGLVGRELHGRFSLQPRSEGGTIATVEFPLQGNESRGSDEAMTQGQTAASSSQRVLIVEDDTLVGMGLKAQLEQLKHTVVGQAANATEAAGLFQQQQPTLVLMDIRLDETDGIDLAVQLLKERRVPIIIVSAYSDPALIARAGAAGVFGYLIKPASTEALAAQIEVALSRFADTQRLIEEKETLTQNLETRKLVERAKGILMKRLKLDEPEAHRRLQQESQKRRIGLAEIAKKVIESEELLGG